MTPEKLSRLWLAAAVLMILIILVSSLSIWLKHDDGELLAVSSPEISSYSGQVYIDGAVARPGGYPFQEGDSLDALIVASGGIQADADLNALQLHIPSTSISPGFQRVDINRAEGWLLQALPGVGEIRSQAILDYRQQIGHFDNIEQLKEVPGITQAVFDKIKDYITIGER